MYRFYLAGAILPITPGKLTMKINNRNQTVSLVDDTTINRLKAPGLTDISFTFEVPAENAGIYPWAFNTYHSLVYTPAEWVKFLSYLKTSRAPFRFIVTRIDRSNIAVYDTNLNVSLEDYQQEEDAENGDDFVFQINLKTYMDRNLKNYTIVQASNGAVTTTATKIRSTVGKKTVKKYRVQQNDSLWLIAKKVYGDGAKWAKIYAANKAMIENTAKKHGHASSSNGWWIYPGEVLAVP